MEQRALIDLDMLLDTRYGVLRRLDPKAASIIVTSQWYGERESDTYEQYTLGQIKDVEFKEMYAKREVETLGLSIMTDFVYELRKDVISGFVDIERISPGTVIKFYVNYYGYDLLPAEVAIISDSLSRYIPIPATVEMVSINLEELTPAVVKATYDMMALYNYEDWLKYHQDALIKTPIPDVCLITPRISPSGIVPVATHEVRDPFMAVPAVLARYLQLVVVPSAWVSCNHEIMKKLGIDLTSYQ